MLKVNCGLSRKLIRDFNIHGFSVNIEAEVAYDLNDAEAVVTSWPVSEPKLPNSDATQVHFLIAG